MPTTFDLVQGPTRLIAHAHGGMHAMVHESPKGLIQINAMRLSPLDAPLGGIWLRPLDGTSASACPLIGPSSVPARQTDGSLAWSGGNGHIQTRISLHLVADNLWIWRVDVQGRGACSLILTQDLGLAMQGAVLANELYVSHYIGHSLLEGANGRVVASRQNMPQAGHFPALQAGTLGIRARAALTDGLDFFGRDYPFTRIPAGLCTGLPDRLMQGEWAVCGLETEAIRLDPAKVFTCGFYTLFHPDHPHAMEQVEQEEGIALCWDALLTQANEKPTLHLASASPTAHQELKPFVSPEWDEADIARRFPDRRLEERDAEGRLLSFFTPLREHVVLQHKERQVLRPHGHIITSGVPGPDIRPDILSATHGMHGQFGAQITVGNTSLHKLSSTTRGLYDAMRWTGLRLWLQDKAQGWQQLSLPAACIFDLNSTRWFYALPDGDVLAVRSWAVPERPELVFEASSELGRSYALCLSLQVVMGEHEWLSPYEIEKCGQELTIRMSPERRASSPYPDLQFTLKLPDGASLGDDRLFHSGPEALDPSILTIACHTNKLHLELRGQLTPTPAENAPQESDETRVATSFEASQASSHKAFAALSAGFALQAPTGADAGLRRELEALNTTVWWYTHNAMIHYAAPHGLEQPGGAAWGTRDVCQGPLELFLAFGQHARARATLLRIFAHQSAVSGEWPQWFMFDRYQHIFAADCHGDVVFWPLFALAAYLEATHDAAILDEMVPFAELNTRTSLRSHLVRALDAIAPRLRELNGQPTALVSYAGGDWDDTLQPAHEALKDSLVSAWTQALASQTMTRLGAILMQLGHEPDAPLGANMISLGAAMAADFHRYLVRDGQIAGFISLEEHGGLRYLLHPEDSETGIHCRLLPLTRSIIAGLADAKMSDHNIALMDEYLACPDGMRLMDRPAHYRGGISHMFQRAEQAAYIGREVSLQYVHAHIRYIEAMCAAGKAERAWQGLFAITPPTLREHVPNAGLRQSNAYFSSSDGAYPDRASYEAQFDLLRQGEITVNGGWRIYSSGPGIYIRQVVQGLLGVRMGGDALILAPTLPLKLHGLSLHLTLPDLPALAIHWSFTHDQTPGVTPAVHQILVNGQAVNCERAPGVRPHGLRLPYTCLTPGADGVCVIEMLT